MMFVVLKEPKVVELGAIILRQLKSENQCLESEDSKAMELVLSSERL